MSESWDNDGDNSKKSRTYSREFTNQSRYNDRRDQGGRFQGRGRRDNDNSNYGRQNQSRNYNQSDNSNRQQYDRNSQYNSESNFSHSKQSNKSDDTDDLILQIQTFRIGKLIGRGGSTVKDLQSQSGCRISIDSDRSSETVSVTLTGDVDAQQNAKQLINDLMNTGMDPPQGRAQRSYNQPSRRPRSRSSSKSPQFRSSNHSPQRGSNYSSKSYERNSGDRYQSNQSRNNYNTKRFDSDNYQNSRRPDSDNYQSSQQQNQRSKSPEKNQSSQQDSNEIDFSTFDWSKANELFEKAQKERWAKLPPLKKYFYKEDSKVANMTKEEVEEFRRSNNNIEAKLMFDNDVEVEGLKVPNPVTTFEQAFQEYPDILEEIYKQGFEKPSPIQAQSWPVLMSGMDLIGIAQTGTGKTLAFLLPALIHIDGQNTPRNERPGPNVLVLAPTRELAQQIEKEVGKYSYRGIKAVCVYGGGSRKDQINMVSGGVQIVIATPGRLNDLVQADILKVESVTYLILDEADRMLDMGFEPQIRKTLLDVRPDRQTVMTSATWPSGVRRLAQSYMKNPVQVCIGTLDLEATQTVTQTVVMTTEEEKQSILQDIFLKMGPDEKVMVFFGRKTTVDAISSDLALSGVTVQSIHGGREQSDREQALEDLRTGEVRILLATDVASRGIDIEDITCVVNYDFPRDIEDYVHRVGRTGRAGRTGESITLMTRSDWSHAKDLINLLEKACQEVPQDLYEMAERYSVWEEKKNQERERDRRDAGGRGGRGGRGRGGRRGGGNRWGNSDY
ncbi:probable ATP-dependent RNA helicase DDX43 [Leptopilina boulardi]|uniref:probable ATP-dependent RNA helicase DDX43 n=1 Tax=Leptopilina boulardi TaxID=63433 RepID=UPI0021F534C5|nr:probable ATP-dependent RNA helicase DDX43 [Leptopilina boulardi]XP_051174917.1 probable ATP-dependent RNA helicase DDX43 [Leptopilina boulardi]